MDDCSDLTQRYTFPTPIDLFATLESCNIQYLDINETRALIIFRTAILNIESSEDELTDLRSGEITVYELPRNTAAKELEREASAVIEQFLDQVTAATEGTTSSRE